MSKTDKGMPWFKCFQDAWLEGTRELTPEQRGIYFDCLCLLYKYDLPIRTDDKWVAHQLHVSLALWRRVKKELIACGKLVEIDGGLVNARAAIEIVERSNSRGTRVSAASEREVRRRQNPELPFNFNKTKPQLWSHARARSDHQSKKEEEKGSTASPIGSLGLNEEEERGAPLKTIPMTMQDELVQIVGRTRADELMTEYLTSDMAKNAKIISAAFRGWLKRIHGVAISKPGSNVLNLEEVIAALPKDKFGRTDTSLPKTVSKNINWRAKK